MERGPVCERAGAQCCLGSRRQGYFGPKALGGDRRSGRIEAYGDLILSLVEDEPDITLRELRARLAEQGMGVA